MQTALLVAQMIAAILIVGAVLLQAQGNGFGAAWGGGGETFHTRRGVEKVVFYFTIVAIVLFAAISLAVVAR
jgi:protein translocase SecG subunit